MASSPDRSSVEMVAVIRAVHCTASATSSIALMIKSSALHTPYGAYLSRMIKVNCGETCECLGDVQVIDDSVRSTSCDLSGLLHDYLYDWLNGCRKVGDGGQQ